MQIFHANTQMARLDLTCAPSRLANASGETASNLVTGWWEQGCVQGSCGAWKFGESPALGQPTFLSRLLNPGLIHSPPSKRQDSPPDPSPCTVKNSSNPSAFPQNTPGFNYPTQQAALYKLEKEDFTPTWHEYKNHATCQATLKSVGGVLFREALRCWSWGHSVPLKV